jgi:hypothetical protein
MAKAPRAGHVKTRLCPPLTPDEAAHLYRAFLRDKVEQVRGLRGVSRVVAYAPAAARPCFEALAPDFALVPQREGNLGARLVELFRQLLARGTEGVLVIDSDTPTLPPEFLRRAVDAIGDPRRDLVLGPSADGGYYLIGLRACRPELFEDMPWSTSEVLAETLARAGRLGLRVAMLPEWFDVDSGADLARLDASLADANDSIARHTRGVLGARERSGA